MLNVSSAITAVPLADAGDARRWFRLLQETYRDLEQEGDPSWGAYRESLTRGAPAGGFDASLVEQFATELESATSDPLEEVRCLCELGDSAADVWSETSAQRSAGEPDAPEAQIDPAAWNTFLAENGPRWDGSEASWPAFTQWFLYYAAEAGVGEPATAFIEYVEGQPDRVAVFRDYGVDLPVADARAPEGGLEEGDQAAPFDAGQVSQVAAAAAEDGIVLDQMEPAQLDAIIREAAAEALASKS